MPSSSQRGPQLTPRVEHRLVDRVATRTQLHHQRVERDAVDHDGDEHPPLPFGQLLLDSTAHRGDQLALLGVVGGAGPEAVGQPVPVRGVEGNGRTQPEMPAELAGYLQDHEFVCPGREPAFPAELGEFGRDSEQGIVGRLVGQVAQFRAGDRVPSRAAGQLSTRGAQQQAVQPRQCLLTGRARAAERRQPLRRLIIGPAEAVARTSSEAASRVGVISVHQWHAYRSYNPAAPVPAAGRQALAARSIALAGRISAFSRTSYPLHPLGRGCPSWKRWGKTAAAVCR